MQASSSPVERAAAGSTWLVLPLALVPVTVFLTAGADLLWLRLGVLVWIVAVVVKLPIMALIAMVMADVPPWLYGLLAGVISATSELGIALIALARTQATPTLLDILLFASAAGSVEALVLLVWSWLVPARPADAARWLAIASTSGLVRHQFAVERTVAWLGHLGSRSLLTLGFVRHVPWLGAVAAVTFALTDGVAAYEHQRHSDWFAAATLKRYFALAIGLVALELVVLLGYLLTTA